jgi:peptide/nickel transport system permease protein
MTTHTLPAQNALTTDKLIPEKESRYSVAPQWKLIWWKFRKHRIAVISAIVIAVLYFVAICAEFVAPFDPEMSKAIYTYGPPQPLNLIDTSSGSPRLGAFVYGYKSTLDQVALRRVFVVDETQKIPVGFFVQGAPYKILGLIDTQIHLIGPLDPSQPMYLLGADRLGRDLLSRIIFGSRISLSIGLLAVLISLVLGIFLGGISGYYGGVVDNMVQRLIEFVRAIPTIPLWLGLAAALPINWPPLNVYFAITLILSLVGWTTLARVVRGRFLALRGEDFVMAAQLDGASQLGIIFRHMLPAFASHIIASITLAIPATILSETALSFLGLGLRAPVVSWGVLLQEAQNTRVVATAPWLLLPAAAVVLSVIAFNFLGDGLRDAADPYR